MGRFAGFIFVLVLLGSLVSVGCQSPPPRPPQSLAELEAYRQARSQEFTARTIALHNLRRVLSKSVSAEERIASLRVAEYLGTPDVGVYAALASALSDPETPLRVRHAALTFLIENDYPDLGRHVAAALPHARDTKLRSAILGWLYEHPSPELLGDVVKLWAAEKSIDPAAEARYRGIVERLSANTWEGALLAGLNTPEFFARGSAVEILAARMPQAKLIQRIAWLDARTQAVHALKYFSERFGYVPRTARELLACVIARRDQRGLLARTAKLVFEWQALYGYAFNIRDFHLISRLAGDPLRKLLSRRELVLQISLAIAVRRRPRLGTGGDGEGPFRPRRPPGFDEQVGKLSMADLWNLLLISEMLNRPRAREALKTLVRGDRADRSTQWGGLIFYDQGQAEAKLYSPAEKRGDDRYVPSEQMSEDAFDAMAFFAGHFSGLAITGAEIGPNARELAFARRQNLYGVIFASLGVGKLNVAYFNPQGTIVDVGELSVLP